jgi:hypothetical protein
LGYGTVFKFAGGALSTVYKFNAYSQGSSGVIEGPGHRLYETALGIPSINYGLIYEINPVSLTLTEIDNAFAATLIRAALNREELSHY